MCYAKATKLPVEPTTIRTCPGDALLTWCCLQLSKPPTSAAENKENKLIDFLNFNINNAECILTVFNLAAE